MTNGEKIKMYREMRGISQQKLSELSDISVTTIKKYELGHRNPKPDQLVKLANGLGINASVFYDLDISTVGDVMAILFRISDITEIEFGGGTSDGEYLPSEVVLRFKHTALQESISEWAKMEKVLAYMSEVADEKSDGNMNDVVSEKLAEMMERFRIDKMDIKSILNENATNSSELQVKVIRNKRIRVRNDNSKMTEDKLKQLLELKRKELEDSDNSE